MGSDRVDNMIAVLRRWQGLERQALSDTAEIMEKTDNGLIRIIMEIIRHDSLMHHRVQQFLIDSVNKAPVTVSREDVADIWEAIEDHDRVEKKTIELAEGLLKDSFSPVHSALLDYLLTDEKKHDGLLEKLDEIKRGMSQASGG